MIEYFGLGRLVYVAWSRSIASYSQSIDLYNMRVKDGVQPTTPYFNLFDVSNQNNFLCLANTLYLVVTMSLFFYMKKRTSGFRLRWVLVIYDAINVILGLYVALSTLQYKYNHSGLLLCNPIVNDAEGHKIARVFLLFYLQKYLEYFDTWFFILRKSSRQVTFLHLFHHSSITVVVGTILPFDYNGDMYLPILLNALNHMLIYMHYLLATLGVSSWWSSYITSLQLIQFILIFLQSLLSYRVGPECGSPDFAKVLMIVYMGSMVALFSNFFLQKYILQRPLKTMDLCGVIKRPTPAVMTATQYYHGNGILDSRGEVVVFLPESFPEAEQQQCDDGSESGETNRPAPQFTIQYSLTAIGAAMPMLFIKREVGRRHVLDVNSAPTVQYGNSAPSAGQQNSQLTNRKKRQGTSKTSNHSNHLSVGHNANPTTRSDAVLGNVQQSTTVSRQQQQSASEPVISGERARQSSADNEVVFSCFWPVDDAPLRAGASSAHLMEPTVAAGQQADIVSSGRSNGQSVAGAGVTRSASHNDILGSNSLYNYGNSDKQMTNVHNDRVVDGPIIPMLSAAGDKLLETTLPLLETTLNGLLAFSPAMQSSLESLRSHSTSRNNSRSNSMASFSASSRNTSFGSLHSSLTNSSAGGFSNAHIVGISAVQGGSVNQDSSSAITADNSETGSKESPVPIHSGPLSFTISGGIPHGKVSWTVVTVPAVRDIQGLTAVDQQSVTAAHSSSSVVVGDFSTVTMKQYEDWRAIN